MATEFSEQIIREAPAIEAYKLGLLGAAKDLAETPLNLPAYQAAGLSNLQQQAINRAQSGIGAYAPFLQAGQSTIEAGTGAMGAGAQQIAGVNVSPQFNVAQNALQQGLGIAGAMPGLASDAGAGYGNVAAGSQAVQNAIQAAGGSMGADFAPSQSMLGYAAQGTLGGTRGYNPTAVEAFMNPYQQAVTQNALGEMRRQADIARQGQAARAVGAGAFGGTREGVERAETERGVQDVMNQRILQDYAQNFGQAQQAAMGTFEQQQQRQLAGAGQIANIGNIFGQQAAQQAQLGQAGSSLMGQLGGQQAQMGLLPAQIAGQQANILGQGANLYGQLGQGIGSLAGQFGQLGLQQGSALGQIGQGLGTLGVQQAALGESAQRMGTQDLNTLLGLGTLQQQTAQAQLDAARATQLQQAMTPYQQTAFLSDIYKGAPSTQMTSVASSAPSTSPLLQAAGLGISGLAAATGAQKAGLFGS